MTALNGRKTDVVRTLVEAAPDGVLGRLQAALADTAGDTALAEVRKLVEVEARDRRLRNVVLQPIVALCTGEARSSIPVTFPPRALGCVWRGLKAQAQPQVDEALVALVDFRPGESSAEPFDVLVRAAAAGIRAREAAPFKAAAETCDAARPGGAELFAAYLDLGPVVRQATHRLPEWTSHAGEDIMAATRLAYKDAVAIADDAGPRFFEMLAAQMPGPWMIMRIISAVMDRPTERYLADSEMAGFGERVMSDVDAALRDISQLNVDGGPDVGRHAGKLVELITLQTNELESCVDLSREHGWGARIVKQKKALANVVEARLRDAEKFAIAAMPTMPSKLSRVRHAAPKLDAPPDPRAVNRAMTLLAFAEEVRSSANYGGFASARGKMLENVGDAIDSYVEEVLAALRAGEVKDEAVGRAYLAVAAEFSLLVRDQKAAELVRRRAAVASHGEPPQAAVG